LKVVVDKQLLGWKDLRETELLRSYEEIREVGSGSDLPQRMTDGDLGAYCRQNDCALITCDIKAYTHFLNAGINAVKISKYGHNKESDQTVYIIEIANS
jgi:hypothetical protein